LAKSWAFFSSKVSKSMTFASKSSCSSWIWRRTSSADGLGALGTSGSEGSPSDRSCRRSRFAAAFAFFARSSSSLPKLLRCVPS